MSKVSNDRQLAANFLRQLANSIERGDSSVLNAIGPALHALLYEDGGTLQRPTPAPPKPRKPDPPTIYYDADGARPLNMVRRRVELHDAATHKRISWPHNWQQLCKFARLPEVKRTFWVGRTRIYGDALRLFAQYGFVERAGNGWRWCKDFTPLQRSAFAQQFRPIDTRAPATATHSPARKS